MDEPTYGGKTENQLRRIAIAAPDEISVGDEATPEMAAFYNAFMDATDDLLGCTSAVEEAHRRLNDVGIPDARYAACDDPTCQTKLGHRVKVALATLARLREENANLRNDCAELEALDHEAAEGASEMRRENERLREALAGVTWLAERTARTPDEVDAVYAARSLLGGEAGQAQKEEGTH